LRYRYIRRGIFDAALHQRRKVAGLARKVRGLTKAKTITDAVRVALEHEVARVRQDTPPSARLGRARAMIAALGPRDPDFDMKAFTDEMWGG
jgi:antitoxin VapB